MGDLLVLLLIGFIDLVAIVLTCGLALRLADRDIPGLLKGFIGIVCGIVGELVRVGAVALAMKLAPSLATATTGLLGFLISFRLWNIPVLVGLAFMAGTAAGAAKTVMCPGCDTAVPLDTVALRTKAVDDAVVVACPKCGAELNIATLSWEVLSSKPATGTPTV